MEPTSIDEKELDYWCGEYPDLTRQEVREILEIIEDGQVNNPDVQTVDGGRVCTLDLD